MRSMRRMRMMVMAAAVLPAMTLAWAAIGARAGSQGSPATIQRRPGRGHGNRADMQLIHTLLANHGAIRRTVKQVPNGVETVTSSNDPKLAALLAEHVRSMYDRMKEGRMIRGFDPLFVELFRHADRIEVKIEPQRDGVRVVETSKDPYVVKLIRAHAAAVDGFVRDGMKAMHERHPVPPRDDRGQR